MTKKDYIALAKLIKKHSDNIGNDLELENKFVIFKDSFMDDLCIYLKSDNPNFNESNFREACGE